MLAQSHFPPHATYELLDFFSPIHASSESRARAFLWLCYHYYEAPTVNPFDDDHSRRHLGLIPALEILSAEEALLENLDTPEEKAWGEKMTEQRKLFMENKDKISSSGEPSMGSQEPESSVLGQKQKTSRRGQGKGRGRGVRKTIHRHPSIALLADREVSRQSSLSLADDPSFQSITPDDTMVEDAAAGRSVPSSPYSQHMTVRRSVRTEPNFPSQPFTFNGYKQSGIAQSTVTSLAFHSVDGTIISS